MAGRREDRLWIARDGDEGTDARSHDGEEAHQLGSRARVRDEEDGVARAGGGAGADEAEVAVQCLDGM